VAHLSRGAAIDLPCRQMCGIAGFTGRRANGLPVLDAMATLMTHRGPDEGGSYVSTDVGLSARRLSIIDVQGGHQPYRSESEDVVAVFNGEIYGFRSLRKELERAGHCFATGADGEVIVHAYEQSGLGFLQRIDGMFALAIWDGRTKTLVLARDRLGKKPLHVARHSDGTLSFASELQALLADPKVSREVDAEAIALFLQFGYVPAPWSAFRGVSKLPPGSALVWSPGGIEDRRYWQLSYEPKHSIGHQAALEELDHRVSVAVEARMGSDVPLGAFLSGGIDSSTVVAHMQALSPQRVKTFSIGFRDPRYDERPYAAAVARALGTDHHDQILEADELLAVLPRLVRHYGEPYADSSMLPTYFLARMARAHVTVALTGDGGDELLGGYERHAAARYASYFDRLPRPARRGLVEAAMRLVSAGSEQKALGHKLFRLVHSMSLDPAERFADWAGTLSQAERRRLAPALAPAVRPELFAVASHPLDVALATDLSHYLPDDLLTKIDIATMACSLEARAPLLDYRLVEWAARLPVGLKQRGFRGKRLLRKLVATRMSPQLFARPKMGFAAPVGCWLRQELRELMLDTLLDERTAQRGYLERPAVEKILRSHLTCEVDHSRAIWTILMLELWYREVVETRPRASAIGVSSGVAP
jgi:asparagine synthase (glutamine-hydrolysing)